MGVGVMSGETVKRILRFPIAMVLPLAVILSACQTPAVVRDVHMGADIIYGADVIAYFGLIEALHAQPVYSSKAGFGLKTSFQSPRRLKSWKHGVMESNSTTQKALMRKCRAPSRLACR